MALMERVATLLRANISDLLNRAEDPEKVLQQLVLDMQNQLLQVKTQVAMALADRHLLETRAREQEAAAADWHRRAELAVTRGDDALARAALEPALRHESVLVALQTQLANQAHEAEALRTSYAKLQGKLVETEGRCDLLRAEYRRNRLLRQATASRAAAGGEPSRGSELGVAGQPQTGVDPVPGSGLVRQPLAAGEALAERFEELERRDRVEQILSDLKSRQGTLREIA